MVSDLFAGSRAGICWRAPTWLRVLPGPLSPLDSCRALHAVRARHQIVKEVKSPGCPANRTAYQPSLSAPLEAAGSFRCRIRNMSHPPNTFGGDTSRSSWRSSHEPRLVLCI